MAKNSKKKENVFRTLARWIVRFVMGPKYEDNMYRKGKESSSEENSSIDDGELIESPGKQVFKRFFERKAAVISLIFFICMFLLVLIGPRFFHKYSDAYTEVTLKNIPPNLSMRTVPKELRNDIKLIDSYGPFTVGVSNAGKLYIWGATKIGATGLDVKDIPEEVKNAKIVLAAAGVDHIVAFDENGKFYAWGSDRFGQYTRSENAVTSPSIEAIPQEILDGKLDVNHIKKVTCGYQATAVLMDDGTIYVWGNRQAYSNIDNFLGRTDIVDVDFTLNYIVGLDSKQNGIFTGSRGLYDMARTKINGETEKMFNFLNGRKIKEIAATSSSVALLLDDGSLALTGDFPSDVVEVPDFKEGEYAVDIETGNYHYTVMTNLGNVYSFGGDHYYQAEVPEEITGVAKVYTGSFQSYAVDANGDFITSWGLKGFLFGSDEAGANIAERIVTGGAITMTVGAVAVIIELILGVALGCLSGYFGGAVDIIIMRLAEVFSSVPSLPLLLILTSLLAQVSMTTNQKLFMIMAMLGVLGWPSFAYLTRAQILVARESEYVTAAQAMGVKESRIAFKHILPNVLSVILVNASLGFSGAMQSETSLSFLGMGVMYPQPSWGNMASRASNATAAINFWWQWVFTAAALILTAISINTIGDTLRDVMDPKSTNDK